MQHLLNKNPQNKKMKQTNKQTNKKNKKKRERKFCDVGDNIEWNFPTEKVPRY